MPARTPIAQAVATTLSRRKFIGMLGGAPIAISGSSLLALAACGGSSSTTGVATAPATATPKTVTFNNMAAPTTDADRAVIFTNATIDIGYSDGSNKAAQALSYKTLFKTGTSISRPNGGTAIVGGYYLPDGVTPIDDTSAGQATQHYSDCPDGVSLLKLANANVSGVSGNALFMVAQFEYRSANNAQGEARPSSAANNLYGRLPSPIAVVTLDQHKTTGALTAVRYFPVPTTDVHGLWISCAGSLSPWNTHLSSEEYEPDAWIVYKGLNPGTYTLSAAEQDAFAQFQAFSTNTFGSATAAKPYHYGHVPEVTVNADGTGAIRKHYCMGRISRELVEVMPDKRTVLMGDDATSGGLFMFIADVAGDLSAGTLYAAKLTQTSAANGGAFDISWIKLGHATSAEIETLADSLAAADIMDIKTAATAGYTAIGFNGGTQYVKFASGREKAAAFLETHRYAASVGATLETTKFEGVALNAADKVAYFAMSRIEKTMSDTSGDIQLAKVNAGAVYAATLAGGRTEMGNSTAIDSAWVPVSLSVPTGLLGEDLATADAYGNTANIDKISNPDNLKFSAKLRTLFIGEDSGQHVNNYVWAYNVDKHTLARVLSAPAGGECASLQAVDNLNGFAYLMSGIQHPGDWASIHNTLLNASGSTLNAEINSNWNDKKQGAIGYVSGIPVIG